MGRQLFFCLSRSSEPAASRRPQKTQGQPTTGMTCALHLHQVKFGSAHAAEAYNCTHSVIATRADHHVCCVQPLTLSYQHAKAHTCCTCTSWASSDQSHPPALLHRHQAQPTHHQRTQAAAAVLCQRGSQASPETALESCLLLQC